MLDNVSIRALEKKSLSGELGGYWKVEDVVICLDIKHDDLFRKLAREIGVATPKIYATELYKILIMAENNHGLKKPRRVKKYLKNKIIEELDRETLLSRNLDLEKRKLKAKIRRNIKGFNPYGVSNRIARMTFSEVDNFYKLYLYRNRFESYIYEKKSKYDQLQRG